MQEFSCGSRVSFFPSCSWRFLFMFFYFWFFSIPISGIAKHLVWSLNAVTLRFNDSRQHEIENWIISSKFQFPYQCVQSGDRELVTACVPRWACFCERHWGETPNSGQLCKMSFHLVNGTERRNALTAKWNFIFIFLFFCVFNGPLLRWLGAVAAIPIRHEVEISISQFFFVSLEFSRSEFWLQN